MKDVTKQRILDAASYLFHKQGYNATGINQVIEEAGVAKTTLYQHYASKEELAEDYLLNRHLFWMSQLTQFVKKGQSNSDKLLLAFDFLSFMNRREDFQGCCFLKMLAEIQPSDVKLYEQIVNHKKDLQFFLASLIQDKDAVVAKQVYVLYEGAMVESQLYKNNWPIDVAKQAVAKILAP